MPTVDVVYCRSHHISTPILRAGMWSQWSHEALVIGDEVDTVIESTFLGRGVGRRSFEELLAGSSKFEIRKIECPRPDLAYEFARKQIGAPYDAWGVVGIGLHRDWQDHSAWFCSELVEACIAAGGNERFIHNAGRVTPQHSWMVR